MNIEEIVAQSRASIEKEDLKIILELVGRINPKNILEIGTWKGFSAEVWLKAFKPESFLTIEMQDVSIREKYLDGLRYQYWYGVDSHDESLLANIKNYYPEGFDFLFIDGDHSYNGVKQDFEMYEPLVRSGGIIILHDALYHADKTEEVDLFWNEIKQNYQHMEFKESKNSTGIGIIFKS